MGKDVTTRREKKHEAILVAEYFHQLDSWLDTYFGGLRHIDDWESLFIHLAHIVANMANSDGRDDGEKVDVKFLVMPKPWNIFQATRLMYQAIGRLRTGVPDGQHRMAAMIELLCGWKITVDPSMIPAKTFAPGDHSGLANELGTTVMGGQEVPNFHMTRVRDALGKILHCLKRKVTVRVIRPHTAELESQGEEYSQIREQSQSQHKPRGLVDA